MIYTIGMIVLGVTLFTLTKIKWWRNRLFSRLGKEKGDQRIRFFQYMGFFWFLVGLGMLWITR
ncbi:hypothetical protein L1765_13420 [Microaerobacter geothermalis]|uniref:hypothetical protein n=1 Tax=Microaerobacter geothermalis TaxID=674972 RepID=UPI001F305067|nr:hypothetical protein [Microaerobacter geothermalis]MCF6094960.1 hypothetical protein [Microaerobacter geothermalis]